MTEQRDFAIELAAQASAVISTNFGIGVARTWKGDGSVLTATDTQVNRMVIDAVTKKFPGHAVLGEEESIGDPINSEWTWVCDPIDGTLPFSHGVPISTFALALTQHGKPVLAVVSDPFLNRVFIAERGHGATLNGQPIHVNDAKGLRSGVLDVEAMSAHDFGAGIRTALLQQGAYVWTFLSVIYPGCLVAAGELVGVVLAGKSPWDAATLQLIIEEAGGKATDLFGNEQLYDRPIRGFVGTNGHVHDLVLAAISEEYARRF